MTILAYQIYKSRETGSRRKKKERKKEERHLYLSSSRSLLWTGESRRRKGGRDGGKEGGRAVVKTYCSRCVCALRFQFQCTLISPWLFISSNIHAGGGRLESFHHCIYYGDTALKCLPADGVCLCVPHLVQYTIWKGLFFLTQQIDGPQFIISQRKKRQRKGTR